MIAQLPDTIVAMEGMQEPLPSGDQQGPPLHPPPPSSSSSSSSLTVLERPLSHSAMQLFLHAKLEAERRKHRVAMGALEERMKAGVVLEEEEGGDEEGRNSLSGRLPSFSRGRK